MDRILRLSLPDVIRYSGCLASIRRNRRKSLLSYAAQLSLRLDIRQSLSGDAMKPFASIARLLRQPNMVL